MKRLFVAIDLPPWIREELNRLCLFGIRGVKWVMSEQYHLSLSFIGEVDDNTAHDIAESLSKVKGNPFDLSLSSVGAFPGGKSPRVIWAGVSKSEYLMTLQKKVGYQLNQAGIKPEKRKFSPHITLGRVKSNKPVQIGDFLVQNGLYRSKLFKVTAFHLYLSRLTPKGAVYSKEQTYLID
jgi:RNA 2',3'-cyclic 3'-phosphodiesterase